MNSAASSSLTRTDPLQPEQHTCPDRISASRGYRICPHTAWRAFQPLWTPW
ncbi:MULTISPECIES: hypothetical protein [Streptomyces]|uniref:hypothetical protein n=1 Tax=Streptomyces TaxID=1883 RepID=UPI00142D442B|nr:MULTISPECIES: hypothetical protein [Streptomyces]